MDKNQCKTCGSLDTYWYEEHPDTGMDEMVLRCRECESRKKPLPLSFRVREKASILFNVFWGANIVAPLFRIARWSARKGGSRCTWCGGKPGFSSCISSKGLRCMGNNRDCMNLT